MDCIIIKYPAQLSIREMVHKLQSRCPREYFIDPGDMEHVVVVFSKDRKIHLYIDLLEANAEIEEAFPKDNKSCSYWSVDYHGADEEHFQFLNSILIAISDTQDVWLDNDHDWTISSHEFNAIYEKDRGASWARTWREI